MSHRVSVKPASFVPKCTLGGGKRPCRMAFAHLRHLFVAKRTFDVRNALKRHRPVEVVHGRWTIRIAVRRIAALPASKKGYYSAYSSYYGSDKKEAK